MLVSFLFVLFEYSSLLGCYVVSLGKQFPVSLRIILASSPGSSSQRTRTSGPQ